MIGLYLLFTFLFLWYWTRAILCSKWAQKRTNYYPLLKKWWARSIVHAHVCVKTPKSIVKSYKEHSLKVSAQSDHKHKRYRTLMILIQILKLFLSCPTVDFWDNQLITNHPNKPIWKIYKHNKQTNLSEGVNKCPWKFTNLSGNLTNHKPISGRWRPLRITSLEIKLVFCFKMKPSLQS